MRLGRWESFGILDGLPHLNVPVIMEDRKGCLWFGTWGGGVSCYDGQSFVTFTKGDGLAGNRLTCIMEDREGYLWFGEMDGGISRYDGESFVNFTVEDGLADNRGQCILEDREGDLWFVTGGGVSRYDGQGFQTMTVRDGLSCNVISCILEDREGYLWFGTNGGGVCKYDGRNFQEITSRDGLSHDVVFQIIQDKAGRFWFATPNGVTRYTPPKGEVKPRVRITQAIADKVYEFPLNYNTDAGDAVAESAYRVPLGQWLHVAAVRTEDNYLNVYVDGESGETIHSPGAFRMAQTVRGAPSSLYLGADTGVRDFFAGKIDEFSLINRALDHEEIIMQAQPGAK